MGMGTVRGWGADGVWVGIKLCVGAGCGWEWIVRVWWGVGEFRCEVVRCGA